MVCIIFIEQQLNFTAVVCANDEMAAGAMKGAREHHINVPQACSLSVLTISFLLNTFSTAHNH